MKPTRITTTSPNSVSSTSSGPNRDTSSSGRPNKTDLINVVSGQEKIVRSSGSSPSPGESITTITRVKGGTSSSLPVKMTQTPPQQYCLRWNNYQNNLTNVFDQLLQSEAFVDVTLACDGHSLKAHKMVLSACSPFFQTLFFDNPCTHPIVILKDISWYELKSVVEFMYRGEINVSQEQLAPLLKVAEMLKIRGLADVSRGSGGASGTNSGSRDGLGDNGNERGSSGGSSGNHRNGPNPADFMSTSNHDSDPGSPVNSNGHLLNHPLLQGHHLNPLNSLLNPNGSSPSSNAAHAHALASLNRRKRRKMSTPERTPSPPEDDLDDHSSNQLEVDSQNGDWNNDHSPRSMTADRASSSGEPSTSLAGGNGGLGLSISLTSTPTPANTPSLSAAAAAAATVGMSLAGSSSLGSTTASSLVGSLGPAFLNLHAAAAAAVANANSNAGGVGGGSGGNNPPSTSSSLASDLDLKPGIVEMIREEERAKMLESSHGWLGPSAASSLTDTYQYQIQNLWQKCWNQNQGGVVHALRFRERGPLKSWRPETMAEAIFAVLRDGLSLSQAARKYDIPYPTFVLYANRVHNMLGPSADGCTGTDLMSDMRPKGRGRPQRILLGSWPEEHIRGVIRAVVFRDTPTGKDDFPFIFNRETGLCLPPAPSSSSHNGSVDMTLQQFGNPFLNPNVSSASSLLHHHQPTQSTTTAISSLASSSSGGNSNSAGVQQSATNLSSSAGNSNHGVSLININEHGSAAAAATAAALQHLQQLEQQGTLSASTASSLGPPGSPQSNSNSPLQQVLNSAAAGLLSVQAQRELLALQQRHFQQQRRHSMSASKESSRDRDRDDIPSPLGLFAKKSLSSLTVSKDVASIISPSAAAGLISDAEMLQIKAELPSSLGADDDVEENDNEELDGNNLRSNRHKLDEQEEDDEDDQAEVIPLNEGDDEEEQFSAAFKHCVNNPGQSLCASAVGGGGGNGGGCGSSGHDGEEVDDDADMMDEHHQEGLQADLVKILNRNSTSPDVISGNNSGNSPKSSRSGSGNASNNDSNGNANSSNKNNSPKGSASNNSTNNHNAGNSNRKRSIENNNQVVGEMAETLAGHVGQGMTSSSSVEPTTSSHNRTLADSTSTNRRASLRGTTIAGGRSSIGEGAGGGCGTASIATPSATPGISPPPE